MPRAKKSLGQNFLVDSTVINQLINYVNPDLNDNFLEIGPGKGAITRELLSKSYCTHAVEMDNDLSRGLKDLSDVGNFHLHNENILDFNPSQICKDKIRVIGNLPYNISTPIMFWSFKYIEYFSDMHFMFQKEFGDRLIAKNDNKNFGRISVITQYLTRPKFCFSIEPESFSPRPKVKSVFIRFEAIENRSINDAISSKLQEITQLAFMHKRKMVGKSFEKIISSVELTNLNIDPKLRPENISVEEYIKIAETLL
jgi:16S rRNA (adenine1518-N6/adenine1519-N6)-dimethyltransferase